MLRHRLSSTHFLTQLSKSEKKENWIDPKSQGSDCFLTNQYIHVRSQLYEYIHKYTNYNNGKKAWHLFRKQLPSSQMSCFFDVTAVWRIKSQYRYLAPLFVIFDNTKIMTRSCQLLRHIFESAYFNIICFFHLFAIWIVVSTNLSTQLVKQVSSLPDRLLLKLPENGWSSMWKSVCQMWVWAMA